MAVVFLAALNVFALMYAPQPLLPLFRTDFHLTASVAGLVITVTNVVLAVSSFAAAPLLDRWDRRRVMVFSSALLVLPSVVIFLAPSFLIVLVGRAMYGLFIPGVSAVMMAYVSEEFPQETRGRVFGVYVTSSVVGGLFGRLMAGPIAQFASWHDVFLILAVYSVLVVPLLAYGLPPSRHAPGVVRRSVGKHFKNRALVGTFGIGFSQFFTFVGFFTYLSFYLSDGGFGLRPAEISLMYGTYAFGLLSAPLGGRLSDRVGRRATMAISHLVGIAGIALTLWHHLALVVVGASLLVLGNFAAQSAAAAHVNDVARASRGAATSLYQTFYYTGGALGSWLPGLAWEVWGWHGVVWVSIASLCLALLCNKVLAGTGGSSR